MVSSLCVCGGGGGNNIREGNPHGSRAPVVTCGPSINYRSAFDLEGLSVLLSGSGPTRGGGRSLPPPPLGRHQEGMHAAARSSTAQTCRDGGHINLHTPEVVTQARPPAATQAGTRQAHVATAAVLCAA